MRATFIGANIKGTPAMRASLVRQDLRTLKRNCDVLGVQEFKWPWYWRVAMVSLNALWNSFPRFNRSLADSSHSAQALFWKQSKFKLLRRYSRPAYDFKVPAFGIMDKRWIRAVLLRARADHFTGWFLTAHFVVNGDQERDEKRRKELMLQNLVAFEAAINDLRNTGYPIMGEIDANIHEDTWAYEAFMLCLRRHNARVHGEHGVEFSFTINGPKGAFTKVRPDRIPIGVLNTDHEARVLHWWGTSLPD